MLPQQPRVFISYQRTDHDVARRVREHLHGHGVRTWMDQFDIPVGAYWPDEIDKSLVSSDIIVGILSPEAVESRNVKNEWDWALQHDKPLLLLLTRPTEVPHRYVSINFIDATTDVDRALDMLLHTLGIDVLETVTASPPPAVHHGARRVVQRYPSAPVLVGREQEQTQLEARLSDALAGHGSLVLLSGEAGIGKTTLTRWLLWAAEERGALVRLGGCYDLTTPPPYGPWGEILRGWPGAEAGVPEVPVELREGTGMGAIQSQAAFFALAGNFLVEAAQARPLVLALEDLHWSDQASLDFLHYVARLVGDHALLLVCTWRDDELTRRHPLYALLPSLSRNVRAHRLLLPRLEPPALADLIASRYAVPAADIDRLRDYVQRLTEGNPFFAGEVLRTIEEAGVLRGVDGGWQLGRLEQIHVPSLVQQVIEIRLARLDDGARRLLEVAAVIGHDVPIDLWVAVSAAEDTQLASALEQAIEARLVTESADRARFQFTHALIRETLYAGLVSLRLRGWHRKVADALAAAARPSPDAVAHHLVAASDARAFDWLVHAGDRARGTFAAADAIQRYEQAAALIADDSTRAQEHGWLLYRIGVMHRLGANALRGREYVAAARTAASACGDRTLEAYATFAHGLLSCIGGDTETGLEHLRAGAAAIGRLTVADLERSGPLLTTPMAEEQAIDRDRLTDYVEVNLARGTEALWLANTGHFAEVIAFAEPFVAELEHRSLVVPALHAVGDACLALGDACAYLGQPERARQWYSRAIERFDSIGHHGMNRYLVLHWHTGVHWPYAPEDQLERVYLLRINEQAVQRYRGSLLIEGRLQINQLIEATHADHWDGIVQSWGGVSGQFPGLGSTSHVSEIARRRGQRDAAWAGIAQRVPPIGGDTAAIGHLQRDLPLLHLGINLYLDDHDLDGARPWLAAHDLWLERSGAVLGRVESALYWARYHQIANDIAEARKQAERALAFATEPRQPFALVAAHRFLGGLLTELGELDAADEHLRASLDIAETIGIRSEIAWTWLAQAELRAARGEAEVARALLGDVRAVFEPLGAAPTLERAAALEARLTSNGGR